MKHIQNLSNATLDQPSIVTIGVFDGVHRGHQHLLAPLIAEAKASDRLAVVLTLFPHPDYVLHGLSGRFYLTTPEQKARLLGDLGVNVVITHPFNDEISHIRAADFVDELIAHLKMTSLWLTADFALGYQREGNFAYLSQLGLEKGFEVRQIDLLVDPSTSVISSSGIRQALQAGNVEQAAQWLGRPYRVDGPVVHGDHRGTSIGFPTANLEVWLEQVLPANGVYACWATLDEERFMAVTNIGERPTFGGKELRVEAHLLDFNRDIYGQKLSLDFVARLRGEQKFSGFEALVKQISADAVQGREILLSADRMG
ncbi:MAG: bifunctional riboflavin kinase/FAD synthetase [Chloroflexota bacterium]